MLAATLAHEDDLARRPTLPIDAPPEHGAHRAPSLPPSSVVDFRYRVVRELGRGGMGTVMLARDLLLDRPVAIKLLRVSATAVDRARFEREARLLARLAHPNVVRVFRGGDHAGRPYFAMEYLDGRTLDRVIVESRNEWLPLDVVLGWTYQLCDALAAVHEAGYLHRDVKPGNVMIVGAGTRAVLLDFGLVQEQDRRDAEHVSGTPHYLAPEDIRGRPLAGPDSRRSDVYSLGVTLYELLAGRPPFEGKTPHDVMAQHLHNAPPPLRDLRPDLPEQVERVIRRALAKNPASRPRDCKELREELWNARSGEAVPRMITDDVMTVRNPASVRKMAEALGLSSRHPRSSRPRSPR